MESVYEPGEDSYMLAEFVEELVEGKVLDMGTGSGIQAVTAAVKPQVSQVVAVDVNPASIELARRRAITEGVQDKITFIQSDLFEKVTGKFDWVIFNPPYLPSEGDADEFSWAGGKRGSEIIEGFIGNAGRHLMPGGSILLIYSSLSRLELDRFRYQVDLLKEKNLFFEKLTLVRLSHLQADA